MKQVDSAVYTKVYFESDCEGHEDWVNTHGQSLPDRLHKAFNQVKVRKNMKILDYGCGRGEMAYHAAMKGADVFGVDYSEVSINLCKKLPKRVKGKLKFQLLTAPKIDLPDNSVDLIYFIDVIEHLYPKEVDVVFKEFFRVLKSGGKVVIHTGPNREYYDTGYKYYTRWMSMLMNKTIWKWVFKDHLIDTKNPRGKYDHLVHVNECSLENVKNFLLKAKFDTKVWYDSSFRFKRIRDKIRFIFIQPQIWFLKRWFAYDIWAFGTKP